MIRTPARLHTDQVSQYRSLVLLTHGLTCGKAYVGEPLLQAVASPTIALDRYYSGYSAAESLYAASRFTGWEDIIFGDPLGTPYAYGRP